MEKSGLINNASSVNSQKMEDSVVPDQKEIQRRKKQAEAFKRYIEQTGISSAFQIIFAEVLQKDINLENIYGYTAMRLRQIGNDLSTFEREREKERVIKHNKEQNIQSAEKPKIVETKPTISQQQQQQQQAPQKTGKK